MWRPGDVVVLRSVYGGWVRWAFPHRLVRDDGSRIAVYVEPGAQGVWMGRDDDGGYLERWGVGDPPYARVWHTHLVLRRV